MAKSRLIPCFEQVGWFICHPKKYKKYGLKEYERFISNEFKSEKLVEKIKEDQMVMLFALLVYYQSYNFMPEISKFYPLFESEWDEAARIFFDVVDERYYR